MLDIALVLFDDVVLLDVGGPWEVFLTANRLVARAGGDEPFTVTAVAVEPDVRAHGGLGLVGTADPADVGSVDVLVVPGAVDLDAVLARPVVRRAVAELAGRAALLASVCTGALLLADAGLLDDVTVTTHHEDVGALAAMVGEGAVTARWVDAGDVVTSGGLSSGIAMALHLVERLVSRDLAVATATQIEYDWDPDDGIVVT
ncbi:DJ-1/PfpI family protein [Salsipaludibacter albus]|uniref:DJ-1/PfpI family protein n=1 Tax=Salsipaludibacter albus TaxID=2849650 RepID=UPI001EE3FB97|nr:DJ-1/PfpI family protein [Salsipaludibacter albus]MBY5162939.1 DJ-1/PfpI family protein [Salsipaludibacter albus]